MHAKPVPQLCAWQCGADTTTSDRLTAGDVKTPRLHTANSEVCSPRLNLNHNKQSHSAVQVFRPKHSNLSKTSQQEAARTPASAHMKPMKQCRAERLLHGLASNGRFSRMTRAGRVVMHAICTGPCTPVGVQPRQSLQPRSVMGTANAGQGKEVRALAEWGTKAQLRLLSPSSPTATQHLKGYVQHRAYATMEGPAPASAVCPLFPGLKSACLHGSALCAGPAEHALAYMWQCAADAKAVAGDCHARHWPAASHQGGTASITSDHTLSKLYNVQLFWARAHESEAHTHHPQPVKKAACTPASQQTQQPQQNWPSVKP